MKGFSPRHNRGKNLRPPDLYEYFIDNTWFDTIDLENQPITEPLRGFHAADVVIVGGVYTGLSAAYHIRSDSPRWQTGRLSNQIFWGGSKRRSANHPNFRPHHCRPDGGRIQ